MSLPDVVCPVARSPHGKGFEELRYSLRSWETNWNGLGEVWLLGSKPAWAVGVNHIPAAQNDTKYRNVRKLLRAACDSPWVSDPFWLSNDDIFAWRHQEGWLDLWHGGPLEAYLKRLGRRDSYTKGGRATVEILRQMGYKEPLNWGLHTPILVHKAAMKEALAIAGDTPTAIHLRSLYGAIQGLQGTQHHDIKISGSAVPSPEWMYVSTSDISFQQRAVGREIRQRFSVKSRFEH